MEAPDKQNALHHLSQKVGFRVLDKPSDLFAVSYDGLKVSAEPCALVKINRTEQVGELLK